MIRFQDDYYIYEDGTGVAGQDTLEFLVVKVQQGDSNYAVRAAKYLLYKFEPITPRNDSYMGGDSVRLIKAFQGKMDISETGIIYGTTWAALFGYDMYPIDITGSVYASVCIYPSTLTNAQMNSNVRYIYDYLRKQEFNKAAACGVLGNLEQESRFNPGIWQVMNNIEEGYGLAQWSKRNGDSRFLQWAYDLGFIKAITADNMNAWTRSDPITLMKAELNYLTWSCRSGEYFHKPEGDDPDHTGIDDMTYIDYKDSDYDVATLTKVFHDYYEKSKDSEDTINLRVQFAEHWFNTL